MVSHPWQVVAVFVFILILIILIGVILLYFLNRSIPTPISPIGDYYRKTLLTKAEQKFYYELCKAAGRRYYVFPQIRLADIVQPRRPSFKTLQPITSKSVDFVLCDPETFDPLIVVELDDATHEWDQRKRRDVFVNQTLRGAHIKVIRQKVQKTYDYAELLKIIRA